MATIQQIKKLEVLTMNEKDKLFESIIYTDVLDFYDSLDKEMQDCLFSDFRLKSAYSYAYVMLNFVYHANLKYADNCEELQCVYREFDDGYYFLFEVTPEFLTKEIMSWYECYRTFDVDFKFSDFGIIYLIFGVDTCNYDYDKRIDFLYTTDKEQAYNVINSIKKSY